MYSTETMEFFEKKLESSKKYLKRAQRSHDKVGTLHLQKKISFYEQAIDALLKVGMMGNEVRDWR